MKEKKEDKGSSSSSDVIKKKMWLKKRRRRKKDAKKKEDKGSSSSSGSFKKLWGRPYLWRPKNVVYFCSPGFTRMDIFICLFVQRYSPLVASTAQRKKMINEFWLDRVLQGCCGNPKITKTKSKIEPKFSLNNFFIILNTRWRFY